VRRLALKSALSSKVLDGEIVVLDELVLSMPKTKEMANILSNLQVGRRALIVDGDYNNEVALSSRNIPGVKFVSAEGINVLDVIYHDKLKVQWRK